MDQNASRIRARNADRWRNAGLTLKEVASRLGVSQSRVQQIILNERLNRRREEARLDQERERFRMHIAHIWPKANAGK